MPANPALFHALKDELCRSQINAVWLAGGNSSGSTASGSTTTIQCERINVAKVFNLTPNGAGTTATCAAPNKVVDASGTVITNINSYPGGVVKLLGSDGITIVDIYNTPTLIEKFRAKYGLTASADGAFSCMKSVVVSKTHNENIGSGSKGTESQTLSFTGAGSISSSASCVPENSNQTFDKMEYVSGSSQLNATSTEYGIRRAGIDSCCTGSCGTASGGACDEGKVRSPSPIHSGALTGGEALIVNSTSTSISYSVSVSKSSWPRSDNWAYDGDAKFSEHGWCCSSVYSAYVAVTINYKCHFNEIVN